MSYLTPGNLAAAVGLAASLAWLGLLVHLAIHHRMAISLADLPDVEPADGWPRLAVIVAARDEEAMIGRAARSLLAQDYPALEVIAVDDRSADRTGAILDGLAREDGRLRVVHVVDLPVGWLGKTHALQRGASATDAAWLLFTDADVIVAPGVLRRAVALACRDRLDHLIVGPDTLSETFGERIFLALFAYLLAFRAPVGRIVDRASRAYFGVGAFNLVRAEAFRDIGGLGRVALSVDDDMRLGQALKYAGYRNGFILGDRAVAVRWQVGLGGLVRGLEKNFFALVDFRPGPAILAAAAILALGAGPILGLFVGPWWSRAVCGLGVLATMALLGLASFLTRIRWYYALTLPISGVVVSYALLRSMTLALRRRGIAWRGTTYPLQQLRDHVKLRNHWLNEVWYSTR